MQAGKSYIHINTTDIAVRCLHQSDADDSILVKLLIYHRKYGHKYESRFFFIPKTELTKWKEYT